MANPDLNSNRREGIVRFNPAQEAADKARIDRFAEVILIRLAEGVDSVRKVVPKSIYDVRPGHL